VTSSEARKAFCDEIREKKKLRKIKRTVMSKQNPVRVVMPSDFDPDWGQVAPTVYRVNIKTGEVEVDRLFNRGSQ